MRLVKEVERIDADGVVEKTATITSIGVMPNEPPYIKLYIEDLGRLMGLQDGHRSILLYVAASVDYDGFVSLTQARKQRIAQTAGVAPKSVDNAITAFLKAGILHRVGRCEYELNPSYFARGKWAEIRQRREAFSLKISYDNNAGRRVVGVS